ncbi:MAG: nuclear transport factor 2 family protein, partial [Myxococcota bacterium]|nr:nuclear transport factor 2 family protein [Myxococcota bacterium]
EERDPDLITSFYRAWNQRDLAAIMRALADDGRFGDPFSRVLLSGDALRAHLVATLAALPELTFSVQRVLRDGCHVAAVWSLSAICTGALDRELAASGVAFTLEGVDLFQLSAQGIVSVRRTFERRDLVDSLGMQSFVEPIEVGTMTFGYSLREWVSKAKPALLGMTWIQARDEEEKGKIRGYARRIIKGFRDIPGFIGVVTGFAGLHGFTLTAWESEEALRAGIHGPDHVEAMRGFHQGTSAGVFTSVWQPLRLNRMWLHCAICGAANDAHRADGRCHQCSTPLPEPQPYV